jgi:hypothetical protein
MAMKSTKSLGAKKVLKELATAKFINKHTASPNSKKYPINTALPY